MFWWVLALQCIQSGSSFRACSRWLKVMVLQLRLQCKSPCHSTLLNWAKRVGYYQLCLSEVDHQDYILLMDESVGIGQEKLLVIYAIGVSSLPTTRPLVLTELRPVAIASQLTGWKGIDIYQQLKDLPMPLNCIKYVVADQGNNLRKALALAGLPHVADCTHMVSNLLEKLYKNNPDCQSYLRQLMLWRKQLCVGQYAHVIPPRLRGKARFMHLKTLVDWGVVTSKWLCSQAQDCPLMALQTYQAFLAEAQQILAVAYQVLACLKEQGLCQQNLASCKQWLSQLQGVHGQAFAQQLSHYLEQTIHKVEGCQHYLCCSDIVESAFGQYKAYLANNPMVGITDLALIMATFSLSVEEQTINQIKAATSMKQLRQWRQEHLAETLTQKRRKALGKNMEPSPHPIT